MKKYFLFTVLLIIFAVTVSSQSVQTLGYFKDGSDIQISQVCSDCSYVNISVISHPNLTSLVSDVEMSQSGVYYSYLLSGDYTKDLGRYIVCGSGDPGGTVTAWCYDFFINSTGREDPSGSVIALFIIAFLVISFLFAWLFIYSLGHAIRRDFDIVDLGFDYGIYFAVLSLYILQKQYLGSPLMDDILNIFVYVGAFTHILASSIFFFISLFRASAEQTRSRLTGGIG